MLQKAFTLTMILLTINAMLLVTGFIGTDSELFNFAPTELQEAGTGAIYEDNDVVNISSESESVAASDPISDLVGGFGAIKSYFDAIVGLFTTLVFGYIIAMQVAQFPPFIIFVVGIPLAFIQLIGLFYLAMMILSAIRGGSSSG